MFLLPRRPARPSCRSLSSSMMKRNLAASPFHPSSASPELETIRDQTGLTFRLRRTNPKLETYYREQGACPDDREWSRCLSVMRSNLPQSVRINASRLAQAEQVRRLLEAQFWRDGSRGEESSTLRLRRVDPGGFIWQANTDRWAILQVGEDDGDDFEVLRAEDEGHDGELARFHDFLRLESEAGNVSRQELVSMAPVLCLDVRPHHAVLDLCASPGSKTKQVLEALHEGGKFDADGFVVANEINPARCFRLTQQVQRLGSPKVLLVNQDGRDFPDLHFSDGSPVRYDRVVCDQPCSGDGTLRKNPTVWARWNPGQGNRVHSLQLDIARRGLTLLRPGGIMAYSSCSMNPVENEAVVAGLLREGRGNLEVVDAKDELERRHGLKCATGFTHWKVFDGRMNEYSNWDEVPTRKRSAICPSMFPPPCSDTKEHLSKCMRFLPHHNDCGGFFVALLKKTGEFSWPEDALSREAHQRRKRDVPEMGGRRMKTLWKAKKLFTFLPEDHPVVAEDLNFYGLSEIVRPNQLHGSERMNKLQWCSDPVRDLLQTNFGRLNVFGSGTPLFRKESKSGSPVGHALVSRARGGGTAAAKHFGSRRTAILSREDFIKCLKCRNSLEIRTKLSDGGAKTLLEEVEGAGPVKLKLDEADDVEFLAFKGRQKVEVTLAEGHRYHLLTMLKKL